MERTSKCFRHKEMKKRTRVLDLFLVLVMIFTVLASCANADKESDISIATTPPNIIVCADTVVEEGHHNSEIVSSFFDEYGTWYYIVYLGQIEDFIFQVHQNFQYTKAISDPKIVERRLTSERVKQSYQNIITNSTSKVITNEISDTLTTSAKIQYGMLSAGVENKISVKCQETWSSSFVEVTDNYLETENIEVDEVIKEYSIKGEYLEENKWYCYAQVATVDVYAAIVYNPREKAITQCEYYSDIVSYGGNKLFVSNKNDFMKANGSFNFNFDELYGGFVQPNEFVEVFGPITENFVCQNSNITVENSKELIITDPPHYTIVVPLEKYDYCVENGYSKIRVKYKFSFYRPDCYLGWVNKPPMLHLFVNPYESWNDTKWGHLPGCQVETCDEGEISYEFELTPDQLKDYKTIYFSFRNSHYYKEYYIKGFRVDITYIH